MNDAQEPIDPLYQQGFNEGYLVMKHWQDMAQSLAAVQSDAPRMQGFRDGQREFVLEHIKEQRPKWMQVDKETNEDKDQFKDKDRTKDYEIE